MLPQAGKFAESSISMASVNVGQNGSRVSLEDWASGGDIEDSSTIIVAVASLGDTVSEGGIFLLVSIAL